MGLPRLIDVMAGLPAYHDVRAQLPSPGRSLRVGGLAGSCDAVFVAALARALPHRAFVVVTDQLSDAERWLADLETLVDDIPVALYPPREGFGEVEPHAEVAGERVETLERLGAERRCASCSRRRARCSSARRCRRALAGARLELRKGDERRPEELAEHLESIGFERVPMVEDVAQFSVRGGIFDIYSFGMAEPVRLEFWGDEIVELRHFDLNTQRSTRDGRARADPAGRRARARRRRHARSASRCAELWPTRRDRRDPGGQQRAARAARARGTRAAHHIEISRVDAARNVPPRDAVRAAAGDGVARSRASARLRIAPPPQRAASAIVGRRSQPRRTGSPTSRFRSAAGNDLARPARAASPAARWAEHGHPLRQRRAGRTSRGTARRGRTGRRHRSPSACSAAASSCRTSCACSPITRSSVATGALRRTRRYGTGAALDTIGALKPGDYVVHLEHGIGIYRGIERIFVRESTIEAAVIEYEGGDRLNVPLYRIDQIERYRSAGDVVGDMPAPRLHKLGGNRWKQQREKTRMAILEMTQELLQLYARRKVTTRPPHERRRRVAAAARKLVPLRGHARPAQGDGGREAGPRRRQADGPPARRRRRLRQDGDRDSRGVQGRADRAGRSRCSCRPRFSPSSMRAASATGWPTFPIKVEVMSRFQTAKEQAVVVEQLQEEADRHRHRHASPAEPRRAVRESRAHRRRRGAPLRREAQGTSQAAQARDRRAHAHGHADSAHAASVAGRLARHDASWRRRRATARRCSRSSSRGTTA